MSFTIDSKTDEDHEFSQTIFEDDLLFTKVFLHSPSVSTSLRKAQRPWQRIHIVFAGPFMGNNYFFIVTGDFTKWLEVNPTNTTTSEWCIRKLIIMISTFGISSVLVSDNGPQFTSHTFKSFLKVKCVCAQDMCSIPPCINQTG
jgi:hypothetical protein